MSDSGYFDGFSLPEFVAKPTGEGPENASGGNIFTSYDQHIPGKFKRTQGWLKG